MGQFVGCIEGMAEACRALDFPVVSGNVSFYNETGGTGILPTPSIGGLGLIADLACMCGLALQGARTRHCCWWAAPAAISAAPSTSARSRAGRRGRRLRSISPPSGATAISCAAQIESGRVSACHDISDGGLLVALAEMALAALDAGRTIGARIAVPADALSRAGWLFGEDQARYLLSAPRQHAEALVAEAESAGVPVSAIGVTGGAALTVEGASAISIAALRRIHEEWLPAYMAGEAGVSAEATT